MCVFYDVPGRVQLVFHFGAAPEGEWRDKMSPLYRGPFVRSRGTVREMLVGQWGMIPPHSETSVPKGKDGKRMATFNARREGVSKSWTYGGPWRRGQRCIIPAQSYVEPYWRDNVHTAWQFARADGEPWGLAGLWSEWIDPVTGEVLPNYTMLTQNCDGHPLLGLMHRPDTKRPPDRQDKRSVVPLDKADWETWLNGSIDQAEALIRVPSIDLYMHGPADPNSDVRLPL